MKIKAHDVYTELRIISSEINSLLRKTDDDCEIDGKIEYEDSAEGRMYQNEIHKMLEKLESVKNNLNYLSRPVSSEGYLQKNSSERYELNGYDFTCGDGIEVLITDEDDREEWRITRIEHDGEDYYAVGCKGLNLEGVKARTRH